MHSFGCTWKKNDNVQVSEVNCLLIFFWKRLISKKYFLSYCLFRLPFWLLNPVYHGVFWSSSHSVLLTLPLISKDPQILKPYNLIKLWSITTGIRWCEYFFIIYYVPNVIITEMYKKLKIHNNPQKSPKIDKNLWTKWSFLIT